MFPTNPLGVLFVQELPVFWVKNKLLLVIATIVEPDDVREASAIAAGGE
jgi:hypothetical protein